MLCPNCNKLAFMHTKRSCIRCQNDVFSNISVLCDSCSSNARQCAVCLKKVFTEAERARNKGCGCGRK